MQRAVNRLGIVFFPAFDWAISPTHPERQERLLYTMDQLKEEGLFDIPGIREYKPDVAELEDIRRVHFCFPDTASNLTNSHLISAGGAIKSGQLVMENEEDKTFALVRPPGHHAMKVVHGGRGFCNVNMEAIMVENLRRHYGVGRVAIVDTDCHHGDGTQDIYWHDPETLYISIHQDGRTLFPGTGFPGELGGPKALGKTINIPLPPASSDEGMLYVIENVVLPILEDFKPELIINSAGQDNHFSDPITNMNVSAQGYARLNQLLNPDIAVLEGGYSIQGALPYVNLGIALAMAGLDYSSVREPDYDPDAIRQEQRITEYIKKMSMAALDGYFSPPTAHMSREKQGDYFIRSKEVFYDTSFITERQREFLLDCDHCPGLLRVETSSSKTKNCLGLEIPRLGCERCRAEGERIFAEEQAKGKFTNIQFIDRVQGTCQRAVAGGR
ncbi:histone deacetylase family protein [Desulfovermiculus halophilus]|uniref:histone deacetylase family protein n=1 Tax=Desulfovermiculus halophilus TaxID=339722 RepID=UPI00047F7A36|nr:histone deacetylase [Desulfovermiculus halophilus]